MLELIVKYSNEHPICVVCHHVRKNRRIPVYEGEFFAWNLASALKRYGRCVMVGHTGSIVMSVNKNDDQLLLKEITGSGAFLWNDGSVTKGSLLFAACHELEPTRTFLKKAGCEIIQELLFDVLDDPLFPELNLKSLSDQKLYRWLLQKLKMHLLVISSCIMVMVLTSYLISEHIAAENSRLYKRVSVSHRVSGQEEAKIRNMDKLRSRMENPIHPNSIYSFDKIALVIPAGIKFTALDVSGNIMMIEGTFDSSEALSGLMKSVSQNQDVKDIDADRIDVDSKGKRIFTLKIWLQ